MSTRETKQAQSKGPPATSAGGILQRKCACGTHTIAGGECDACAKTRLQRRASNRSEPPEVPSVVHDVLRSPGHPLDGATRAFMESRFGHDFNRVRVHTDGRAAESARAVNALAFTAGHDVVFGAGRYAPQTDQGFRLLAHELTHVVQQRDGVRLRGRVGEPGDAYERQADEVADWVARGKSAEGLIRRPPGASPSPEPVRPQQQQQRAPSRLAPPAFHLQMKSSGGILIQKHECDPPAGDAGAEEGGAVPKEVIDHLKLREGWCENVYTDSRGLLTAGMGHLLTETEKTQYKEGDTVPLATLQAWAQDDATSAYEAAVAQGATLGVGDQGFINALASVNFQLGTGWYTEHKKTWAHMVAHEWEEAAVEAQDSKWYEQTPVRVEDFQAALRALSGVAVKTPAAAGTTPAPAASVAAYEFKIGAPTGRGTVTATSLTVRRGPGKKYEKTGASLAKGASVTIYGEVGGWHCIGQGQWVSGEYVSVGKGEAGAATRQHTTKAKDIIARYATYFPLTSVYINLDEAGLARLLSIYAKFDGKLVLGVFDALQGSDTDDVAYYMASRASNKELATFDRQVLARMKLAMKGWIQMGEETRQIARIDSALGAGTRVADVEALETGAGGVGTGVTIDDLKSQIAAGVIKFDEDVFRAMLLGENTKKGQVAERLQKLVLYLSKLETIKISSIFRNKPRKKKGLHDLGRAIDIGNETIAKTLLPQVATDAKVSELGIDELIFDATMVGESDGNKWNYKYGKKHDYGPATLKGDGGSDKGHTDHIHFGVKAD